MAPCPLCGEMNSVRRAMCFKCGQSLAPPEAPSPSPRRAVSPTAGGANLLYGSLPRVRAAALFFRQFHSLSKAGIPPVGALSQLSRQGTRAFRLAAAEMAAHAASGGRLSDVMADFPNLFLAWQTGLVRAAETGGFLPEALDHIASALEDELRMRLGIMSRVWYLYFLVALLLLLLPLALAFRGAQPEGGWTPQALLETWTFGLRRASLPVLLGIIAASLFWQFGSRLPSFRAIQQRIALRLPIFGPFSRAAAMARFAETLASLWQAGVPANTAVEVAAAACGNYVLAPRLAGAALAMQRGRPATSALADTGVLPPDMLGLIHSGEVSGSTAESISRVARYYRSELENMLHRMPRLVFLMAWVVVLPFALWIWYVLFRAYVHFRFEAPFEELHRSMP